MKYWAKFVHFRSRKCIWKCLRIGGNFVSASMCWQSADRVHNPWYILYLVVIQFVKMMRGSHKGFYWYHYSDVIMGAMASQIISHTIVYSTVYSVADQRKHQSSASLGFVRGIHRWPVNSPYKWPVARKMFSFDDVIISLLCSETNDQGSLLLTWFNFNPSPAWISNYTQYEMWDEIPYLFSNFNGETD